MSMKAVIESEKRTPVVGEYDVIVAGGGPAGFSAAVTAAREGARVCLVEQCGGVGGVATSGLMSHWTGNTRGGIYEEILDRSADGPMRQTIHPEKLPGVLLEMLLEAGVEIRLYTFVVAPVMDGDRVAGVVVESKSGRQALLAKVVVDATGDGDVAARAGAEFRLGREGDSAMQPMTLMFKVGGVDMSRAILPPSFDTLRTRLQNRAGDSPDEIQRRLHKAKEEVWSYREYYYIVRNDDLKQSLKELESIFLAERIKTKRLNMTWLEEKFILDKEGKQGNSSSAPASKEHLHHG